MKFDVTAVIKEIGVIEEVGTNSFQKRNLILSEQSGEYENLICIEFSGEKLTEPERYQVGQTVKAGGFINCREWEGRYFTSLRGSFVQSVQMQTQPATTLGQPPVQPQQAPQVGQAQAPVYNQTVGQHVHQQLPPQQQPQRQFDTPPPIPQQAGEDIPFN